MKKCYFCGEEIPGTTILCPWCGRRDPKADKSPSGAAKTEDRTSEYDASSNRPRPKDYRATPASTSTTRIARFLQLLMRQWIIVAMGCGLVLSLSLLLAIPHYLDASNYSRGHHAYQMADCAVAIENYDTIASRWRIVDFGGYLVLAQREQTECLPFQAAAVQQQAGHFAGALVAYTDYLTKHGASVLTQAASTRVTSLFEQTKPSVLATTELCSKTDVLIEHDLIPDRDTYLPPYYYACGQMYEDRQDFVGSIQMYEAFQRKYPTHGLTADVAAALARAMVAEARRSGAGEIPAPQRSGSAAIGSTVVDIRNDSPERIQLVFSGPEARIEELAACGSCVKYAGVGPASCPSKGPTARYTLKPGNYDVLVKSTGNSAIIPFTGKWDLSNGIGYSSCFFVATKRSP